MTEPSRSGVLQQSMQLFPSLAMSRDITPARPPALASNILPPHTPDERSRELCAQSKLLVWRARRACAVSQQLRARLRRYRRSAGASTADAVASRRTASLRSQEASVGTLLWVLLSASSQRTSADLAALKFVTIVAAFPNAPTI
jgi:hypothetical protein